MRAIIYSGLLLIFFTTGCEEPVSTTNNGQIVFHTSSNSYFTTDSIPFFIENKTLSDFEISLRCGSFPEMYYQKKEDSTWSERSGFSWMSLKCLTVPDTIKANNTFKFTIPPAEIDTSGTYRLVLAIDTSITSNSFEIK